MILGDLVIKYVHMDGLNSHTANFRGITAAQADEIISDSKSALNCTKGTADQMISKAFFNWTHDDGNWIADSWNALPDEEFDTEQEALVLQAWREWLGSR